MTLINETYNKGIDILIIIQGGVIQDVEIPEHLTNQRVIVYDYDVDVEDEEQLEMDEDGDRHHTGVWMNKQLPIIDGTPRD